MNMNTWSFAQPDPLRACAGSSRAPLFRFLDKVDSLEGLNKPHRRYNSKHDLRLMAKLVGTCDS
jgi:hypothetical protein